MSSALASDGPYVTQKYSKFAKALDFKYDPQTGDIEPASTQQFINENNKMVSDLGSDFYGKDTWDPTVLLPEEQTTIHSYATIIL